MTEPISGAGAATVTLTGITFASLLSGTDAGVFIGAFAGAVVYVLSSTELTRMAQVGYFIASFLIGVLAADLTTGVLTALLGHYLPAGVVVSKSIGATVASAIGVYFLLALKKVNIPGLLTRLFSGGGNGDAK